MAQTATRNESAYIGMRHVTSGNFLSKRGWSSSMNLLTVVPIKMAAIGAISLFGGIAAWKAISAAKYEVVTIPYPQDERLNESRYPLPFDGEIWRSPEAEANLNRWFWWRTRWAINT
eukprot:NODE_2915_length_481_cov_52.005650_g2865_i0.p1 GENE.NODE_2915_length_481_cov_52.005650_g2865_i0~~NODE_2915_length_481_cov_52.005650_g2865_i0.p1  ORF type:complete len:117 (+),score=17.93 NODE_2915_length_481_cov_52.005650_g2865_i0:82-432(+)